MMEIFDDLAIKGQYETCEMACRKKMKQDQQDETYSPIKDGMEKGAPVHYGESPPPAHLSSLAHCFWELRTLSALSEDFNLHAVPDTCVNILFNILDPRIAGVTALRTEFEVLNLGRQFHYAGIQFLPGVWQGDRSELFDSYVGSPYSGSLPLVEVNRALVSLDFAGY